MEKKVEMFKEGLNQSEVGLSVVGPGKLLLKCFLRYFFVPRVVMETRSKGCLGCLATQL